VKGNEFNVKAFEVGRAAVNSLDPKADIIFVSGDLTFEGTLPEYKMAKERIEEFESPIMIIPGNHDARHMGYKLFTEFFGDLEFFKEVGELGILGIIISFPFPIQVGSRTS
jgi:3',5'-cyclic AMP phosphodiesterase CpdA